MPKLHGSHILSATLAGCLACTAGAQVQNTPGAPGASPASVRPGLDGTIDVDQAPDRRRETDSLTGKPVYLLHDGVRLHPPTAEMLSGVDVLVVDLQDAGARYYTYPSAVATIMQAAVPGRFPVIVLD